ncbi:hypothetical protein [Pseudonocardia sp. GCM10023141]|uniref:hypothetical protein n=1 Tax=Pseudonocardia sp. GCM10023141 TaxID=3252653 RepID=UPI00360A5839
MDVISVTRRDDQLTRVIEVPAARVPQIRAALWAARTSAQGKSVTQRAAERPRVQAKVEPGPLCVATMCPATVTLTNTGDVAGTGRVDVLVDGASIGTHPYRLDPGQRVTVTDTFANRLYTDNSAPGSRTTVLVQTRVVPD